MYELIQHDPTITTCPFKIIDKLDPRDSPDHPVWKRGCGLQAADTPATQDQATSPCHRTVSDHNHTAVLRTSLIRATTPLN
jgi:hypothetical protein